MRLISLLTIIAQLEERQASSCEIAWFWFDFQTASIQICFYHTIKVRKQEAAKDHAVTYVNCIAMLCCVVGRATSAYIFHCRPSRQPSLWPNLT